MYTYCMKSNHIDILIVTDIIIKNDESGHIVIHIMIWHNALMYVFQSLIINIGLQHHTIFKIVIYD